MRISFSNKNRPELFFYLHNIEFAFKHTKFLQALLNRLRTRIELI